MNNSLPSLQQEQDSFRIKIIMCFLAALTAWFFFCAAPALAAPASSDPDMDLYKEKMGQAFTLAYNVVILLAALYYVSAVIRYFAEDSSDGARKHLLGAGAGLFISVSALPIINLILGGFFPESEGYRSIPDGATAVTLALRVMGRMFTFMLNAGILIATVYIVVAALKYSFSSDSGDNAKSHLIRVMFGLFLLVIARTVIMFFSSAFYVSNYIK